MRRILGRPRVTAAVPRPRAMAGGSRSEQRHHPAPHVTGARASEAARQLGDRGTLTRRRVLGSVLAGWVAGAFGAVVYPVLEFFSAPPLGEREQEVTLTVDSLAVGEAVQIIHRGKPIIVVRDSESDFLALSAVCTHLGCIVRWDHATRTLVCPCHEGRFAADGHVLGGPPQTSLPLLATRVDDDGRIDIGAPE